MKIKSVIPAARVGPPCCLPFLSSSLVFLLIAGDAVGSVQGLVARLLPVDLQASFSYQLINGTVGNGG